MPLYSASFTNLYAYPKLTLPVLEYGVDPQSKMYVIQTRGENDDFTGAYSENNTALIGSLSGSGEQVGTSEVGYNMHSGDAYSEWCDAPTAEDPVSTAGFNTVHAFGIVYVESPGLAATVDGTSPHDRAFRNKIRKVARDAGKLFQHEWSMPAKFEGSDFTAEDDAFDDLDVAALQQWIIDNLEYFVHPNKISTAAGLPEDRSKPTQDSNDYLTIGGQYLQFHQTSYDSVQEYFFRAIAGVESDGRWGFSYSVSENEDGIPIVERPNSTRTCAENDNVTFAVFKDIARCLDVLRAGYMKLEWTANGEENDVEGDSDDGSEPPAEYISWGGATQAAEDDATGATDGAAPEQHSIGGYTPDPDSESSSSSSSSTGDPGSSESSSGSSSSSSSSESSSGDSSSDSSIDSDPNSSDDGSDNWSSDWFSNFYSDWWSDNI